MTSKLKIATWNCKGAYRKKQKYFLEKYEPDIWIIQECEDLDRLQKQKDFQRPDNAIWFGDNPNRGISIFSRAGYDIAINKDHNEAFKYIVPIKISGLTSLNLFAIWAMNSAKELRKQRYIGQVFSAFNYYKLDSKKDTLITGDFNWNLNFDSNSHGLIGKFKDFLTQMDKVDFQSIYHKVKSEAFGLETKPTLFLQGKNEKPYHIDYIFGNNKLIDNTEKVEIGKYDEWIDYSDHMPLYTEIRL